MNIDLTTSANQPIELGPFTSVPPFDDVSKIFEEYYGTKDLRIIGISVSSLNNQIQLEGATKIIIQSVVPVISIKAPNLIEVEKYIDLMVSFLTSVPTLVNTYRNRDILLNLRFDSDPVRPATMYIHQANFYSPVAQLSKRRAFLQQEVVSNPTNTGLTRLSLYPNVTEVMFLQLLTVFNATLTP